MERSTAVPIALKGIAAALIIAGIIVVTMAPLVNLTQTVTAGVVQSRSWLLNLGGLLLVVGIPLIGLGLLRFNPVAWVAALIMSGGLVLIALLNLFFFTRGLWLVPFLLAGSGEDGLKVLVPVDPIVMSTNALSNTQVLLSLTILVLLIALGNLWGLTRPEIRVLFERPTRKRPPWRSHGRPAPEVKL